MVEYLSACNCALIIKKIFSNGTTNYPVLSHGTLVEKLLFTLMMQEWGCYLPGNYLNSYRTCYDSKSRIDQNMPENEGKRDSSCTVSDSMWFLSTGHSKNPFNFPTEIKKNSL